MLSLDVGAIAALAAALFWAIATLLYANAGNQLSATQLNWVKGWVAAPLLLLAVALFGHSTTFLLEAPKDALFWLLLSGVIGITLGDTLYFSALRRVGPATTMLLEYLAPLFAAVIAWLALAETLSTRQLIAAGVIIAGVLWVITERRAVHGQQPTSMAGVLCGIGAALCQAVGLVMAFYALQSFKISALDAALLRMGAGTIALSIALFISNPHIIQTTWSALQRTHKGWLLVAIILGTFIAIWLQQLALTTLSPGLAQTLLATAPLWLILIKRLLGERTSVRGIVGASVALVGIALLLNNL